MWLVTEDEFEEGQYPPTARVLDLDQRKLFPPYETHSILARGEWTGLHPNERPNVDEMLKGVDQLEQAETTPTTEDQAQVRPRPEPVEWMAWQVISGPGTVDERRTQLLQLLDTSPDKATVRAYLGDLDVEEDLVNRVLGEE